MSKFKCVDSLKIDKIYFLNPDDCVFENSTIVRIKRKYGKFKREIYVIDKTKKQK